MNLRAMMEKRLTLGDITQGSTVMVDGEVTYIEKSGIQHGRLHSTKFTVIEIGKNTLRLRSGSKEILLTSADTVRTIKD